MRDVCRADVWGSMSRVLAGHGRSFCAEMNVEASGLAKQVEKWIKRRETRIRIEIRVGRKKVVAEILPF